MSIGVENARMARVARECWQPSSLSKDYGFCCVEFGIIFTASSGERKGFAAEADVESFERIKMFMVALIVHAKRLRVIDIDSTTSADRALMCRRPRDIRKTN